MKIINSKQAQLLDKNSISKKLSFKNLMENAGKVAFATFLQTQKNIKSICIIGGKGNNGGDGWVFAHEAIKHGFRVHCFLIGNIKTISFQAKFFYDLIPKEFKTEINDDSISKSLQTKLSSASHLIDALFGIGLNRPLNSFYIKLINIINHCPAHIISLDISSGINADNGNKMGAAIESDLCISFELPKWGHVLNEGIFHSGKLIIRKIGLKKSVIKKINSKAELIEGEMLKKFLPRISIKDHKYSRGRASIIAGSKQFPGSGFLSALAVLKSGCGYSSYHFPAEAFPSDFIQAPEVVLNPYENEPDLENLLKNSKALGIGPGMEINEKNEKLIFKILSKTKLSIVCDAGALGSVLKYLKKNQRSHLVLTPHLGEFSRLINKNVRLIENDRLKYARSFSKKYKVWLILKGAKTLISGPKGECFFNNSGNALLATAGSGDILTGLLSGLLAQGLDIKNACLLGVYLHGLASDLLLEEEKEYGHSASDLFRYIPKAFAKIENEEV